MGGAVLQNNHTDCAGTTSRYAEPRAHPEFLRRVQNAELRGPKVLAHEDTGKANAFRPRSMAGLTSALRMKQRASQGEATIGLAGGGPLEIGCTSHAGKGTGHSTSDYSRVILSVSSRAPKRPVGTGSRRLCRGDLCLCGYGRARRRVAISSPHELGIL
jgi:hypothetical protein